MEKSSPTNRAYFLCSKSVVDFAKPTEVSKPFLSGYADETDEHFIASLDFEEVEKHYNQLSEKEQNYFWCQELVGGTMDVSGITLKGLKENGVFLEIERGTRLTTTRNRAMTIYNLAEKFNCTPIELINKVINH